MQRWEPLQTSRKLAIFSMGNFGIGQNAKEGPYASFEMGRYLFPKARKYRLLVGF